MNIFTYSTSGVKDLIREFLESLPKKESAEGYFIIRELEEQGIEFLKTLNTRQLERKLWEIKFQRHNRIFYVLVDEDNMYLLHACKKQKGKAENSNLKKLRREQKKFIKNVTICHLKS